MPNAVSARTTFFATGKYANEFVFNRLHKKLLNSTVFSLILFYHCVLFY